MILTNILMIITVVSPNYKDIEYTDQNNQLTSSYINIIDDDTYIGDDFYFDVDPAFYNDEGVLEQSYSCWDSVSGIEYEVSVVEQNSNDISYSCRDITLDTTIYKYSDSDLMILLNYISKTASENSVNIFIISLSVFIIFIIIYLFFVKKVDNIIKSTQKLLSPRR